MSNRHYQRLLFSVTLTLFVLIVALGIVLGQFFHIFSPATDEKVQQMYWVYILFVLLIAFIVTFVVLAKILKHYTSSLSEITSTVQALGNGQYLARVPTQRYAVDDELAIGVNQLGAQMQELEILRNLERERFDTLTESIGSGLLMFGRSGHVRFMNTQFEEMFHVERDDWLNESFHHLPIPLSIEAMLDDIFLTEQPQEKRIRSEVKYPHLHIRVHGSPVIGRHGDWLGVILVFHDVTELVHLEEVRKDFVANVSHELRTPITSIKGFTETLLEGAMEDPQASKQFLEIIQKESNRLQLLVDDLLELSRIERNGFDLQFRYVPIQALIEDACHIVSAKQKAKNIDIVIEGNDKMTVEGDRDRLLQVFVNLLSNAIVYSARDKTVCVTYAMEGDEVVISVQDEGIGISQKEQSRLFERFYRVDKARSRNSGGTGLGLAIVKHLVEAHNGSVTVESKVDEGSTFIVRLPIRQENSNE